jgi:RNA polymerase sigma-70 factor (ECF subfamily)
MDRREVVGPWPGKLGRAVARQSRALSFWPALRVLWDVMTDELSPPAEKGILALDAPERERRVMSLYARRGPELYGFAAGFGLSGEEAADAVQDAMFRLWRELDSGKELRDLDAWAFRTTYNLVMDQHRLRRRLAGSLGRLMAGRSDHAPDPADSADAAALWQAVDRLPARQRAVLYLRYRADLPFDRIGLVLGITAGAARSHSTNALATLRRRLGPEES